MLTTRQLLGRLALSFLSLSTFLGLGALYAQAHGYLN